jgi:hypothetical protein
MSNVYGGESLKFSLGYNVFKNGKRVVTCVEKYVCTSEERT